MTVYIDNARIRHGNARVCHMMADTLPELHTLAKSIGLTAVHFQHNTSTPHYVVNVTKRNNAVKAGAKPLNSRESVLKAFTKMRQAAFDRMHSDAQCDECGGKGIGHEPSCSRIPQSRRDRG